MRYLSILILIAVGFITAARAQDDSTDIYLNNLNNAAAVVAVAESAMTCPEMLGVAQTLLHLPQQDSVGAYTRRGERSALLAYWTAAGHLYAAQAAYLAYTGDRVGAYFARRERDNAYAKSYAYIPSQVFEVKHEKHEKLPLDSLDVPDSRG